MPHTEAVHKHAEARMVSVPRITLRDAGGLSLLQIVQLRRQSCPAQMPVHRTPTFLSRECHCAYVPVRAECHSVQMPSRQ